MAAGNLYCGRIELAEYDTDPNTKEGMDKFFAMLNINIHSDSDGYSQR